MLSRFTFLETRSAVVRALRTYDVPMKIQVRRSFFPRTPYDSNIKHKIHFKYIYNVAWESLPIVIIAGLSVAGIFLKTIYAFRNKVDVALWFHDSEHTISRTMNLYKPTVHKLITITQQYEPWPEMQEVLDKMREAENQETA